MTSQESYEQDCAGADSRERVEAAEYAAYQDFPKYNNPCPVGSPEHRAYDLAFAHEAESFNRTLQFEAANELSAY